MKTDEQPKTAPQPYQWLCTRCRDRKPREDFREKYPGKISRVCRACENKKARARDFSANYNPLGETRCKTCGDVKSNLLFYRKPGNPSGQSRVCIACISQDLKNKRASKKKKENGK